MGIPGHSVRQSGGLVFTWAGMEVASAQELHERCMKALTEVGVQEDSCKFFADVLKCEYEINTTVQQVHQSLRDEKWDDTCRDPDVLLKGIQDLTKSFNVWKASVDTLCQRGRDVKPLTVDSNKLTKAQSFTSLCSLETKELDINEEEIFRIEVCDGVVRRPFVVNLKEGDQITITDTSQPNRLKVRTSGGEEGFIPALSCLLPSPDRNALSATDRLRVQLLASWTQSVKKLQSLLFKCLALTCSRLATDWKSSNAVGSGGPKDRVARRLKRLSDTITKSGGKPGSELGKLHNAIFSLEKELNSINVNGTDVNPMIQTVATLDKSVLCYQMFVKQWQLYRKWLERSVRPVRVVEQWEQLRPVREGRKFKYFEVKMTLEEVETVEEIIYANDGSNSYSGGSGSMNETVETDQITRTSGEERKRFIIRAVVDPRNGLEISIQEAVELGIVDQNKGMYVNPATGETMSIPMAMNNGHIKVEHSTTTRAKEETKAVGLITLRTCIDRREYTVSKVIDPTTGEKVDPDVARKKGLLDETSSTFHNITNGDKMSLETAINAGWVLVEYDADEGEPEYETKTYAVNAVVDQKNKQKLPFYEAVRRGLINRDTGNYINNVTGEQIYVAEAIRRGFLKAKEVHDTAGLDIDAENKVVVDNLNKIRKNVMKSVGVIAAFKKTAVKK